MRSLVAGLLVVFSGFANATFTYQSSHADNYGTYFFYPQVVVNGVVYAVSRVHGGYLCKQFGFEYSSSVKVKMALWGTYDAVDILPDGQISEPKPAAIIVSQVSCTKGVSHAGAAVNKLPYVPFPWPN